MSDHSLQLAPLVIPEMAYPKNDLGDININSKNTDATSTNQQFVISMLLCFFLYF